MVANDQLATLIASRLCEPGMVFVDVGAHIGSVLEAVLRHSEGDEIVETCVTVRPLDTLVTRADVLKIDVEGAELRVLMGASALIERSRPVIMFESGPAQEDGLGYTKEALWRWLDDRGYAIFIPNRVAHLGAGLSLEGFLESHLHPRRTTNYFAIAHEQRDDVRERARALLGPSRAKTS